VTEEYPDDVEAWIELAGILEQSDVQVHQPYLHVIDLMGVAVLSKVLYSETPPEAQPLTFFDTIFDRTGIPFIYILLTNGTSFTYLQSWTKLLEKMFSLMHTT